jgi:DEAD/DEAH box helicase domain-containing protein
VTPIDTFDADDMRSHGEVHVVARVVGFKKIKFYTNENVGSGELDLPEQQMHTTSYWLTVPARVMGMLPYAADDRRDGVVGLGFALKQVAQLLLMCDGHDIGISISDEREPQPEPPGLNPDGVRLFVYDNYPGGIGFSAPLFQMHDELMRNTRRLIAECDCENGCPGCVGPAGNTGPLAKAAALRILDLILESAEVAAL